MNLADRVFAEAPKPPKTSGYLYVNHELMATLHALLGAAVRIKALLVERQLREDQTEAQYEIHRRRVAWMRHDIVAGARITHLLDSRARNSLDQAWLELLHDAADSG
jgi:class 3 adenylate cyclase